MNLVKKQIDKTLSSLFSNLDSKKRYDKKRKRIFLTLDKKELSEIKKASLLSKKKVAVFVKDLVLSQIKNERFLSSDLEKSLNETCIQIRKIGNNLNQISKKINTEGKIEKNEIDLALSLVFNLENLLLSKVLKNL